VRQNIQFPLRENLVLSDTLMDEIATAKLEMVGLKPEDGDKFPSELSGGMTKRVALARALALDPAIVFLDEPTSGLDPIAAGDFDADQDIAETLGLTVFMVTHDLASLNTVCDRVAAPDGKIVAIGPMRELLQPSILGAGLCYGKRSQICNPKRAKRWKPAPFVIVGASSWRPSSLCSASSTGCRTPAAKLGRPRSVRNRARAAGRRRGAVNGIRSRRPIRVTPGNRAASMRRFQSLRRQSRRHRRTGFQGLTGVPVVALEGGTQVAQTAPCRRCWQSRCRAG
jgi:hypothetical protein